MPSIVTSVSKINVLTTIPGKGYYPFHFSATVTEVAGINTVSATLDWNDGTPPVVFAPGTAHGGTPYTVDSTRSLTVGTYFVKLTATNYRSPVPDVTVDCYTLIVQADQMVSSTSAYLFGPVLPSDEGHPNVSEWNFNMGTDVQVLRSAVKMLLITEKGERLMNPSYGTRLRRAVFEPNDDALAGIIRQEIEDAISTFEPRVSIESIDVQKLSPREVIVNILFLSKLDQTSFSVSLPFLQ
jgi:phage baseplate assembly protein W